MINHSRPEYVSHQLSFLEISPWSLEFKLFNELSNSTLNTVFKSGNLRVLIEPKLNVTYSTP